MMDIRDDPSTTTTTTDYDSGDSEDVEYVYEGPLHGRVERKDIKERYPRRKRSSRTRARAAQCTCGAGTVDENADTTVVEEDTDVEDEERFPKHSRRPRQPSGSAAVPGCHGCHDKVKGKADKKKSTEKKPRGTWVPYIEEYPDEAPRPAILLKEHKIPRRSSDSDAKHVRDSGGSSLSAGSRGRSPTGKRLPPRSHRRLSKESSRQSEQHSRRLDLRETYADHDAGSFKSDSDEPSLATTRRSHHVPGPELTSTVSRSSAWHGSTQPKYSSSWPLNAGSRMPQRRPARLQHNYDSEEESEEHGDFPEDENTFNEQHPRRHNRPGPASFHERGRDPDQDRDRDARYWVSPPPQREHVRSPSCQQPRRQTIADTGSIATMDQGRHSVAASTVYEVWRGRAEDWESPYVSAVDDDDDDYDSEVEEPVRLLSLDDLPPRTYSPHLLPPRGERRGNFGFQSDTRSPPPRYHHHHLHLSVYNRGLSPGPSAIRGISHNPTWDDNDDVTGSNQLLLLLDAPRTLTMEPDAMTDDEGNNNTQPISRASRWSNRHAWDDPPPPPPPAAAARRAARGRPFTHPLALPRSRVASPVFSARKTREGFLSPRPRRAARFDFGAWGCDRASRSSVALGLL